MTCRTGWLAITGIAVVAACAGTPIDRSVLARLRPPAEFPRAELVAIAAGTAGFDAGDARELAVGDTAAFGLVLEAPGSVQRWLVTIAVEAAIDEAIGSRSSFTLNGSNVVIRSHDVHLRVTVADDAGHRLRESTAVVGDTFLSTGIRVAVELAARHGWTRESKADVIDDDEARQLVSSLMTLTALFQLVQGNEALSPILWQTVDVPSVFSMVAHLGVTVSVSAEVDHAVFGAPAVLGSGPTCAVPVTVLANGSPALLCTLFATDPKPPFRLSAGIVAIEAAHPTDATRRFSMRMLAARRGDGPR